MYTNKLKLLKNIFHNYIRNKFILCDNKDPPWINEEIKFDSQQKNPLYQRQKSSLNALALDI